jgi:hypothetical protein
MNKIIIVLAVILSYGVNLSAQNTTFGVKAGANFSNVKFDTDFGNFSPEGATNIYIGVLADVSLSESLHFQPELLYSMEGSKSIDGQDLGLDFFNVPLMLKYYLVDGINIQAGPQIGFIVNDGDFEGLKSTNFGLNFGAAYELPTGFFFDARYNLGLSDLAEDIPENEGASLKTKGFQLGIGYRF